MTDRRRFRPMTYLTFARSALVALLALCCGTAFAQQGLSSEVPTIDIKNGTATATPIAVVPFAFEGGLPPETDIADVIRNDLNRCGQFRALAKQDIVEFPTRGEEIKFATWNMLKQAYIVVGREVQGTGGEIRVEFELYDVAKQQRLQGLAISGQASDLRGVAHQIADLIYEKIVGVRGAFWTRIAYVTSKGNGDGAQFDLM